ncbi:MAG TPA: SpoIIE family protein phosphatase [Thermoleophilaceae bacterium]|jgi:PAS domain S-box-containing protein
MGRARRLRIGLTARVRLATLLVALALGAVFALLLHTVDVSRTRETQARHSADVIERAGVIEGSVIDLETGLRGYIIGRQTRFLKPYQDARATQPQRLKALQQLVMDSPSQIALARQLEVELNSYVNDYAVPLIAAVGAGRRIGIARLEDGKTRVDTIRSTLDRFTATEDRRQSERRAAATSATHRARVFTILAMVLLVLMVVLSGIFASRYVAEPLRNLARSARRLAAGKLDERVEPSGMAELSDLGVAFNQMASSLEEHTHELERLSESSAAQFSAIFEQTPIGLTLFDRDLRCVRCNPALGELAGVLASDQPGKTVSEVFGHFEPDLTAEFGRVLKEGRPLSGLRVTGGGRNCTVGLFPVRRADGELIGVAAVAVDVTEREQRLERERVTSRRSRRLERLASTISEALTPEEISGVVVAQAVAALDGDGGAVLLLDEARQMLTMSTGVGWPLEERAFFTNLPMSMKTPTTDAVRMRKTVHVGDPRDALGRYGDLAERRIQAGIAATLALPLLSGPRVVGGLLVTFSKSRSFSEDELEFAEEVAERCASGIARALLYEREHETAAALQRSLMPAALPTLANVLFGARFRPAGTGEVVGGDFYDVMDLGDGRFVAWIGDVQGKGPDAASVAALARYTLRAETRHGSRPGRLLQALNEAVLGQSEPGDRLLTAVCLAGEESGDKLELEMAIAGHPPPLLMRRDQPCTEWGSAGTLIGFEHVTFTSSQMSLEPGELLVLYTDGLTDAHAPRQFVVAEELCRRADQLDRTNLGDVLDSLLDRASSGGNDPPRDDIALLGMQFAPRTPRGANPLLAAQRG